MQNGDRARKRVAKMNERVSEFGEHEHGLSNPAQKARERRNLALAPARKARRGGKVTQQLSFDCGVGKFQFRAPRRLIVGWRELAREVRERQE